MTSTVRESTKPANCATIVARPGAIAVNEPAASGRTIGGFDEVQEMSTTGIERPWMIGVNWRCSAASTVTCGWGSSRTSSLQYTWTTALPDTPLDVAVMVTVPGRCAATVPSTTEATEESDDDQTVANPDELRILFCASRNSRGAVTETNGSSVGGRKILIEASCPVGVGAGGGVAGAELVGASAPHAARAHAIPAQAPTTRIDADRLRRVFI
jgi:hypothetical protein